MAIEDENIFAAIQAASITQNPLTTVATTLSKAAMISAMTEIGKWDYKKFVGMGSTIKSGYISEHLDENQDNAEERLEEIQESATTNTPDISYEMKIESELHGDVQNVAEMTASLSNDNCNKSLIPAKFISNMVNYKLDQIGEHPCKKNEKSIDDYNLYCMDNTEERPYVSNA